MLQIFAPASAHDAKGPNGGRVLDAGEYHVELVAAGTKIDVFITDGADKPIAADGFKGVAILIVGGKSQRIVLEPSAGKLTGVSASPVTANPKGVVQITPPNGKTAQARYN
jgi:hypothetical protein